MEPTAQTAHLMALHQNLTPHQQHNLLISSRITIYRDRHIRMGRQQFAAGRLRTMSRPRRERLVERCQTDRSRIGGSDAPGKAFHRLVKSRLYGICQQRDVVCAATSGRRNGIISVLTVQNYTKYSDIPVSPVRILHSPAI